jgi:hypothetical protein
MGLAYEHFIIVIHKTSRPGENSIDMWFYEFGKQVKLKFE